MAIQETYSGIDWISENLKIINKDGVLVPLYPNIGQLMLAKTIRSQRESGNPVRILLLKPRQVGWSTWTGAEAFLEINTKQNRSALVVSADTESTDLVFNMTKLFQAEMPLRLKRPTRSSNRKEIVYKSPWRSKIFTQTAGKDVLGRGGTIQFLHASEVAFWPKAAEGLAAVFQMVPKSVDTTIILETTANGVGGAFYDMFWQAVERQREKKTWESFVPVFFPWYKFPEYSLVPPKEFVENEEEKELEEKYGLTTGQLYWRRLKLEELRGDAAFFSQEFPTTASEAFLASGTSVFGEVIIKRLRPQEGRTVEFVSDGVNDVFRSFNAWTIWQMPKDGHEYSMGIDAMEGKASDTQASRSDLDCHGVIIYDRTSNAVVAQYHGRGDQQPLGVQCLFAAKFYNQAWVAPEIPTGGVVLNIFKQAEYPNIYNRQVHDDKMFEEEAENLGWKTTPATRPLMVETLIGFMRNSDVDIRSSQLIDEMRTFIRDKNGKPIHQQGKHDDLLFAFMIAIQLHTRCPMNPLPYAYSHTSSREVQFDSQGLASHNAKDLAYIGAIDLGVYGDEDEQEYTV